MVLAEELGGSQSVSCSYAIALECVHTTCGYIMCKDVTVMIYLLLCTLAANFIACSCFNYLPRRIKSKNLNGSADAFEIRLLSLPQSLTYRLSCEVKQLGIANVKAREWIRVILYIFTELLKILNYFLNGIFSY